MRNYVLDEQKKASLSWFGCRAYNAYLKDMNKLMVRIWLLLGSLCVLYAQDNTPSGYTMRGFLGDKTTRAPIPYAHIYTLDGRVFEVSDTLGHFRMYLQQGDTVVVSSVGYTSRYLVITEAISATTPPVRDSLWLSPSMYRLSTVYVYDRHPLAGFFSHKRTRYGKGVVPAPAFRPQGVQLGARAPSDGGAGIVVEGLMTAIANQFNRHYQQLKKLHSLRQKERWQRYYNALRSQRMPTEWVCAQTGLRPNELADFYAFYQPTSVELETSSDYELLLSVRAQARSYYRHMRRMYAFRSYAYPVAIPVLRLLWDGTWSAVAEDVEQ